MWRKVQVERPRSSTSGGQSVRGWVIVEVVVVVDGDVVEDGVFGVDFIIARHAAPEVQVLHLLHISIPSDIAATAAVAAQSIAYGFPSGPSTTPLGSVCGFSASSARIRCSGLASNGCGGSPVMFSIVQKKYCRMGKSI